MTIRRALILREYETAAISAAWAPALGTVSTEFADAIDRLQLVYRAPVVSCGRRSLRTTNWVGTVSVGGYALDILPKTDQLDNAAARRQLLTMLAWAQCVPSLELGVADFASFAPTVLDAFMLVYVRRLAQEWRRGRLRSYRKVDANRTALRGKLLPAEQLRRNLLHPERFYTRADEYCEDGPIPRLLKAALLLCRRFGVLGEIQREAQELLGDFELVDEVRWHAQILNRLSVDRRHRRFEPLVNLAKMLITQAVPDLGGPANTYSLLFDMNVVFERFIGVMLQRVASELGLRVRLQSQDGHLLIRNKRRCFGLKPDVAVYVGERLVCLVDTKWKILSASKPHEGVSSTDVYQAYAYGKEYACPRVVLLYPRLQGLVPTVAEYQHNPGSDGDSTIRISTIDVGQPATGGSESVAQQLRTMLRAILGMSS